MNKEKSRKDFSKWMKENVGFAPNEVDAWYNLHRKIWDHQQEKIDKLENTIVKSKLKINQRQK